MALPVSLSHEERNNHMERKITSHTAVCPVCGSHLFSALWGGKGNVYTCYMCGEVVDFNEQEENLMQIEHPSCSRQCAYSAEGFCMKASVDGKDAEKLGDACTDFIFKPSKDDIFRCPKCGGTEFSAHQRAYHDVTVTIGSDGRPRFEEDDGIYESEDPYGPYTCKKCGMITER